VYHTKYTIPDNQWQIEDFLIGMNLPFLHLLAPPFPSLPSSRWGPALVHLILSLKALIQIHVSITFLLAYADSVLSAVMVTIGMDTRDIRMTRNVVDVIGTYGHGRR